MRRQMKKDQSRVFLAQRAVTSEGSDSCCLQNRSVRFNCNLSAESTSAAVVVWWVRSNTIRSQKSWRSMSLDNKHPLLISGCIVLEFLAGLEPIARRIVMFHCSQEVEARMMRLESNWWHIRVMLRAESQTLACGLKVESWVQLEKRRKLRNLITTYQQICSQFKKCEMKTVGPTKEK